MIITQSRRKLRKVLMQPKAKGLKEPYYLIEEGRQVIYVISPGKNGIEFNKTQGFINNYPGVVVYQCLYGQGVLIMQRNDEEGEAKEFKVMTLNPGRQVEVPSLWAVCLVNIARVFLVVVESSSAEAKYQAYKPIMERQGLAYHVIEKKGEIGFEQNPNYHVHPQITTE